MLIVQFLLVNAHFVLSLLSALVCFAVAWLYYDAWLGNKSLKESYKFIGFLLLSLSFIAQSVIIEQSLLETTLLRTEIAGTVRVLFRLGAYLFLIIGQIAVPLQPLPEYRKHKKIIKSPAILVLGGFPLLSFAPFSFPLLAATTAILYLRRATTGLENHLKPIALGFFMLSFSELLNLTTFLRSTDNINLFNLVAPFGLFWILTRVFLAFAFLIIGRWVWGYLLKRFENQLFIIFTSVTLFVFLVTTVFFTYATLNNLKQDILKSLKTDIGILSYSIDNKKAELLADALVIGQNPEVGSALAATDKRKLADLTTPILLSKKLSSLIIVSDSGVVILRAEDYERNSESLSSNPMVKSALDDKYTAAITTKEGATAPTASVITSVPIRNEGKIVGAIILETAIDNSLLDGIKAATGLDASIYADNFRSATTFIAPDGKSRWIGIKEEDSVVKKTVLTEGDTFTGSVKLLNVPYFSAFAPLKDLYGNPVGMLFVGRPEVSILQTASHSIELTFMVTAILLALSILPSFFISKYLVEQIK
jgi:hypothetical protein